MGWIYAELVAVSLAAMLSPTTLTFSVLALVLGDRPLRTGVLFYVGALTATIGVGVAAAFVLGDAAASGEASEPKTWVAIVDVVAASLLLLWAVKLWRNPPGPERQEGMVSQMSKVASSPGVAVVGAGAMLANPGAYIPIALKTISETDPSATWYAVQWIFFALVSLLPLLAALVLLLVAPTWTKRILHSARSWLERHMITIAIVVIVLLALALLRNGIAGLTG
ncbi:MAG TPA: GAP family protein [Gaiellaceae bacterium]|nr:GAP family protein [Gaiellaceae bacterium]